MPEDYYSDNDEQEQAPAAATPDDKSREGKGDDYQTALLPKRIFGHTVKPGDTISLKVESVEEDDVVVCPADGDSQKTPEQEESPEDFSGEKAVPPGNTGGPSEGGMDSMYD